MVDTSQLNATVTENRCLSPGLFLLRVLPDDPIPDFTPGQYVALGLPCIDIAARREAGTDEKNKQKEIEGNSRLTLVKRAYSIASSPSDKKGLEFYVARVNEGELSPNLTNLNIGDRLFVQKKYVGTFTTCDVPDDKNLVFIATGTGIAPFISMLRAPGLLRRFGRITILHGVRYVQDLAYRDEITELIESGVYDLGYYATVSREEGSQENVRKGYIQSLLEDQIVPIEHAVDHIFLCGNPGMIKAVVDLLSLQGFREHTRKSPGNLHLENYW
ncbi:MAG: ferredoxin--NADP reductase [Bdellovibrionota bacterium]|jgi:ferredoxin--NADP+ reductase